MDPKNPQDRLKFNNVPPYTESVRAGARHLMQEKGSKKPCVIYQDDEFGKNVLDGFNQAVADAKLTAASVTSYKRGASDFSSQVAKMKSMDATSSCWARSCARPSASWPRAARSASRRSTSAAPPPTWWRFRRWARR